MTTRGQPVETLHGGGVALSCALDGHVAADELHGLFAGDTRVLSTYHVSLGGLGLDVLCRTREGHGTARWHYQNRAFLPDLDVPAGSIFADLRRRVDGAMHDDLQLTSYLGRPLRTTLVLQIDADFADIFEVKTRRLSPRATIARTPKSSGLPPELRRKGFRRAVHVSIGAPGPEPVVVGSRIAFEIELAHAVAWSCCIEVVPEIDGERISFSGDPHADEGTGSPPVVLECADVLARPFRRAWADLQSLAISDDRGSFVAAGAPWFLTLFGRDTLTTALMTGLLGSTMARGTLAALGALQATSTDDWRDAEPGKLPHELRRGE